MKIFIEANGALPAVEVAIDEGELAAADATGEAFRVVLTAVSAFMIEALEAGHSEEDVGLAVDRFRDGELATRSFRKLVP